MPASRVRFTARYIFTPNGRRFSAVVYPAGHEGPVTRECADKAIAAGVAVRVKSPRGRPGDAGPAGDFNGADPAAFDHDGDGAPGGSLPHGGLPTGEA